MKQKNAPKILPPSPLLFLSFLKKQPFVFVCVLIFHLYGLLVSTITYDFMRCYNVPEMDLALTLTMNSIILVRPVNFYSVDIVVRLFINFFLILLSIPAWPKFRLMRILENLDVYYVLSFALFEVFNLLNIKTFQGAISEF